MSALPPAQRRFATRQGIGTRVAGNILILCVRNVVAPSPVPTRSESKHGTWQSHPHAIKLHDGTICSHSHDDHSHGHSHWHSHHHGGEPVHPAQVLNLNTSLLSGNDRIAEQNRGAFNALNLLAINVASSAGRG